MTRPATPDGYVWRDLATDPPTETDLPVLVRRYENGSLWVAPIRRVLDMAEGYWAPLIVPADPPRTVTVTIDVDLGDEDTRHLAVVEWETPVVAALAAAIRDALDGEAET